MAPKRLTRKQLLNEPDEFITLSGQMIRWAKAHYRHLGYGAGAFFALVCLIAGYRYFDDNRMQKASLLLSQTLEGYQQALQAGDKAKYLETIKPDLDKLMSDFGGQPAGRIGRLFAGHFYLTAGQPKEAVGYYKEALKAFGADPSLSTVVRYGLAVSLQKEGDIEAAIAQYEKIVDDAGTVHKESALFNLALLYAQSGRNEKSREMFDKLAKEFPDSVFADLAREKTAGPV